jgi:LPPG:FO 2-phospho-L-lactate transferase
VREAIRDADAVVVCPSNPVTSIGPILAVPGIVDALAAARGTVLAISPIVGGAAVSGPAGDLMRARGLPVSPAGVAQAYAPWLRTLVVDRTDAPPGPDLAVTGVAVMAAEILMLDRAREVALARRILEFIRP